MRLNNLFLVVSLVLLLARAGVGQDFWTGEQGHEPATLLSNIPLSEPSYEVPIDYEMALQEETAAAPAGEGGGEPNNGTNPAQNVRMAIVSNEYYRLDGGNKINTDYLRLKFPVVGGRGALLAEIPFNFYNLSNPVQGQVGGIGDLKFQLNYNLWQSESRQLTFLTMLEAYIPSADNILLTQIPDANQFAALSIGKGKFQLGPGMGFVYAIRPNFIFAPLYFYEFSVAGNNNRPDISLGKWRIFMMYAFPSGVYVLPELQIVTNYLSGNSDIYFAPELGISIKGTTFYAKPGFGFSPSPGDREWGIDFGVRVAF